MTPLILEKKYKKSITAFQKKVVARMKAEEKEYNAFCVSLGLELGSESDETLWDHIFNQTDWTVEYK